MEPKESRPFVLKFPDPRQQRIYEELTEVVGPGPASFFRDACRLMANPNQLESTAHLVAHLLREIESALRQVFRPVAEKGAEGLGRSTSQKEEIRTILRSLGIAEDAREARAWFELADKLHGLAHRRGLDPPRSPGEISELWDESQALLDVLLQSLREHFLAWIGMLDDLLAKPKPNKDDLKRLAQEIPNNAVTRGYFFDRLENPEWLEPLWKKGFFKHPPAPIRDEEEGTIRFPPWPEAKYLAGMAKHKPKLVAQIIHEMNDTDNAAVISDLVEALLAMPPHVSAQFVDKATRWAESPYWLLPEKLGQLLAHWAKGGKTEEALRVARVLLDVLPDERRTSPGTDDAYRLLPEPRARFEAWHYEQILKEHYPDLVRQAVLPALQLLCDLLEKAIQLSLHHEDDQGPEDYSFIWRPAIEDHSQNRGDTIRDALVSAVRDAAELVVRSNKATVEQVANALEGRRWKAFRRVALHILRVFPDQGEALAAARLTDRSLFEDVGLRHEYVLLLRTRFPHLAAEEQTRILRWIEEGPEVHQWKQWREAQTGRQRSEEEVTRCREIWQRDWLARIGPDSLPTEWRERYRQLVGKYGEPEHPAFPRYRERTRSGPTSPKTANELKEMSVTEIVEFLSAWKPPENILHEPSPEGLGRMLSSAVAEDPGRFASEAPLLKGLDPTYVRALVSGLREALKQQRAFDEYWKPVLDLFQWVVSQPRDIPGRQAREMEADPDWGPARKEIAGLLAEGFQDRPAGIPISLRENVWDILKPLTEDPDPRPEHEQRYAGSNMHPATLSINTTRGEAMHAVVRYALWVRRHLEKDSDAQERLTRGFEEMPEVREVLEAHLDPGRDPSLAIRAVYGQWFPWLVLLDSNWARAHAAKIFPQDSESAAYFDAAWNTYVVFCSPYDNVLEILRPFYHLAVQRIGGRRYDTRRSEDPDKELAEHLMVFYWRGKLALDDPLLAQFWEKAPDAVRAHGLEFVGRSLQQTEGDIPAEILDQLKKLWEQRLAAAKKAQQPSDFEKEMAAFSWWFVSEKFDVDWAIAQLSESLQLARTTTLDHMVLEHLARTAPTHPRESVECLRMIAEVDREGWNLYASRDHVRRILEVAMQHPDAADEAKQMVNYLGSRGFLEFRDLLQR